MTQHWTEPTDGLLTQVVEALGAIVPAPAPAPVEDDA